MDAITPEFEAVCRAQLDRFFAARPDATMQKRAMKALRMLRASEKPLKGKPRMGCGDHLRSGHGRLYSVWRPGVTQRRVRAAHGCHNAHRAVSRGESHAHLRQQDSATSDPATITDLKVGLGTTLPRLTQTTHRRHASSKNRSVGPKDTPAA